MIYLLINIWQEYNISKVSQVCNKVMGQIYKSYVWQIEYTYVNKIPGPKAIKHVEEFKKIAYNSTFIYPLVIKTGSECEIEDVDGIKFLDFTSNIG